MRNVHATEEEMARATGLPRGSLRRLSSILDHIAEELYEAACAGKMAFSTAEAASKLPLGVQEDLANVVEEKNKLTAADVRAARQARVEKAQAALGSELLDGMPTTEDVDAGGITNSNQSLRKGVDLLRQRMKEATEADKRTVTARWNVDDVEMIEALLKALGL